MAKAGGGSVTKGWGKLGGGTGKMHSFEAAGTQTPGGSAVDGKGGSRRGIEPKAGGPNGFYSKGTGNKSFAGTQTPGQSAAEPKGGDSKFAAGGSTKMFGNRGSLPAKGGQSGP